MNLLMLSNNEELNNNLIKINIFQVRVSTSDLLLYLSIDIIINIKNV